LQSHRKEDYLKGIFEELDKSLTTIEHYSLLWYLVIESFRFIDSIMVLW
jgi:hypothetical protein